MMRDEKQPRKPNQAELEQLVEALACEMGSASGDDEQVRGLVSSAYIAVFDNYVPDCPGYAGKVMVVVWSGGPELSDTYIWREEMIQRVTGD